MLLNTYNPGKFAFSKSLHNLKEIKKDDVAWAIIGVPFDSTSSYHTGSRYSPLVIREASRSFEKYNISFDKEIDGNFFDFGDINVINGNCNKTSEIIENTVDELLFLGLRPLLVGGEHSISYPVVKRLIKEVDMGELTVIHFDAHMDMMDMYQGEKCSHATVMRRIHELNPKNILQLGIRSSSKEEYEFVKNKESIKQFYSNDFNNIDPIKREILDIEGPIYLSIDCDVFDPAYLPSVGNPVPNGISPNDMETLLKLIAKKNIIGFDIVEVSTNVLGDISALTAAKVIYDFLTLIE